MEQVKWSKLESVYKRWMDSNKEYLWQCYPSGCSDAKYKAYSYCQDLMRKYDGRGGVIISHNGWMFTFGFVGQYDGKVAFFYITKEHEYVAIIGE